MARKAENYLPSAPLQRRFADPCSRGGVVVFDLLFTTDSGPGSGKCDANL